MYHSLYYDVLHHLMIRMLFHPAPAGQPGPPSQSRSWPPLTLPRAAPACQLRDSPAAGTHTCTRQGDTHHGSTQGQLSLSEGLHATLHLVTVSCSQLPAHKALPLCNRTCRPTPADLQVSTVGTMSACMGCCCLKVKGGTTVSQREKQGTDLQGTTQPHVSIASQLSKHSHPSRHSCFKQIAGASLSHMLPGRRSCLIARHKKQERGHILPGCSWL